MQLFSAGGGTDRACSIRRRSWTCTARYVPSSDCSVSVSSPIRLRHRGLPPSGAVSGMRAGFDSVLLACIYVGVKLS
jgi:hypothetical protein